MTSGQFSHRLPFFSKKESESTIYFSCSLFNFLQSLQSIGKGKLFSRDFPIFFTWAVLYLSNDGVEHWRGNKQEMKKKIGEAEIDWHNKILRIIDERRKKKYQIQVLFFWKFVFAFLLNLYVLCTFCQVTTLELSDVVEVKNVFLALLVWNERLIRSPKQLSTPMGYVFWYIVNVWHHKK